jgi:hypothetical protein
VSRNDWHVALENEIEKKADQIILTNEMTAMVMRPECGGLIDCIWKQIKLEAKAVASIVKVKTPSASLRAHTHHKLRTARTHDNSQFRQVVVTVENKLKEKTRVSNQNGFWNQRISRAGQPAYQVETSMVIQKTGEVKKEMSAVTFIGNDASQRGAIMR